MQSRGEALTTLAHFQHIGIGYTFLLPWTPYVRVLYDYASGDHNPTDGRNSRFNSLFGQTLVDYNETGIWSHHLRE